MADHSFMTGTRTGTIGGTLTIILANITSADAIRTAGLAAIGAAVSFLVSLGLKYLVRKYRR